MVQQPTGLEYASATTSFPSRRGHGFLPAAAGLWIPGLGHWIVDERRRAVAWFAAVYGLAAVIFATLWVPALTPVWLVLTPLSWLITLTMVLDGYLTGRRTQRRVLRTPLGCYALGLLLILFAAIINPLYGPALFGRKHLVEGFVMPAPISPMSPTIEPGDRFWVHKGAPLDRWDVLAFHPPEDPGEVYVNRLIGLPGEQVEIFQGKIYIDGKEVPLPAGIGPYDSLQDPKLSAPSARNGCEGRPIRLGKDEYYVLGDNSPVAGDSRFWTRGTTPRHQPGTLSRSAILGVATHTYWPPPRWRRLKP